MEKILVCQKENGSYWKAATPKPGRADTLKSSLESKGWTIVDEVDRDDMPTMDELSESVSGGMCDATDGCTVEPDGVCSHGKPSWLLALGMI